MVGRESCRRVLHRETDFNALSHHSKKTSGLLKGFRQPFIGVAVIAALLVHVSCWSLVKGSTEVPVTLDLDPESVTESADEGDTISIYSDLIEPPSPPSIQLSVVEAGEVVEVISQEINGTVTIPAAKYSLQEGKDAFGRILRFSCRANYPVEWIYEGFGTPYDTVSHSFRHIQNFSDPSTYTFSAFLDLTKNHERNTGKYLCRPYQTNLTDHSFLQLYVTGEQLFLPSPDNSIQLLDDQTSLVIPCTCTDLKEQYSIRLYKKLGTEIELVKYPAVYNPSVGFSIEIGKDIANYTGTYMCVHRNGKKSKAFDVRPPIGTNVRSLPMTNHVKIIPGLKQMFKCEAKENVTLTFSGDSHPSSVQHEMNPISLYPFTAMVEIIPTNATTERTLINCVNKAGDVLTTWEYTTYAEVSISKFYFDSQKRYQDARYVCCTNSFYEPTMEFVPCKTETECEIKKRILLEDERLKVELLGEYSNRIKKLNSSCVYFNPYLKYTLPTGVLRCSVKGISKSSHKDYMYYFNPYRIYQAYTDQKFDAEKVQSSDSIMKLSKTPSRNVLVGQKQRFLCYYSELFLSNGVVWSVEMHNGSTHFYDSSYNDMKSNVSFSQIELTINHTDIKYIHCHAPVKRSPAMWRNSTGWVLMREYPTVRAVLQTPSGDVIQVLSKNNSKEIILDKSTLDILNNSISSTSSLKTAFTLECNASFPVDFVYYGERSPKLDFQPYRHTGVRIENASEYIYSAKLKFSQVNQQIAGKYSCISATREFALKGKEENLQSNFHIFVPGDDLFLNPENQTFRAWHYRDSVLIPCPINDPRVNITLLKQNNQTKEWEILNSNKDIQYDPLQGFSLFKNQTSDDKIFGLYKCRGDLNRESGFIQVYLPSDTVKATPYLKEVKISSNETQTFQCESKEDILLKFSDDPQSLKNRSVGYSKNETSEYPYSAIYTSVIGEFSNLTQINCTSTKDSKAWHTWELYPKDGLFIDKFVYDNSSKEMQCCTKSYRSPTIEWTNCSSITECYIKQSACLLQNKCQSGDFTVIEELDKSNVKNGCLTVNVQDKPHGLLKCTVKGMHKIVSQALVYYSNPDSDYFIYDGYFVGSKIFDKFNVKHEEVMKLSSQYDGQTLPLGEKVTFDCSGSKFFVASEIKWALEMKNGTVEYLTGKDITNYNQVRSQVEIEFDSTEWQTLYCIAPNWKEYFGWRNVSLSLEFENNFTTTYTPVTLNLDNL